MSAFLKFQCKRLEFYLTEPRRDIDMRRYFQEGIQMVMDGMVNTSEMITDYYPLEKIDQAFKLRNDSPKGHIHVVIDCERKK